MLSNPWDIGRARLFQHLGFATLAGVRAAGYADAKIVKIVALCAHLFLTNCRANVFDIDVDFSTTDANTK